MLIGGNEEWWAEFHEKLRDGRYDEEVMDYIQAKRPDLLEDLAVEVVLECWGENDELQDDQVFTSLIEEALRAAPTTMIEFFGDERWRTWWWQYEYNDQH